MRKSVLLLAAGVGYVLGAKAGHQRYEQIKTGFDRFRTNPKVQETAHQAADLAREKAPVVKDKVTETAGAAADKVRSAGGGHSDADELKDELHPDSTARQDDPYPKGDLP